MNQVNTHEPFVSADKIAEFLHTKRRRVLQMVAEGTIPAHPISGRKRFTYAFRISEVAAAVASRVTMRPAAPSTGVQNEWMDQ